MIFNDPKTYARLRDLCAHKFLILLTAVSLLGFASAQDTALPKRTGLPQDWSNRHVISTNVTSPSFTAAASRDPRFWYNYIQRNSHKFRINYGMQPTLRQPAGRAHGIDWAISLGSTGGMPIAETPAKWSFSSDGNITTANCNTDYVVFVIDAAPGASQANIIALNNLYTGANSSFCPFGPQSPPTTDYTAPKFLWSYRAGSGAVVLSPELSEDGTKVTFIESTAAATFDVLTWVAGQGTDSTHPATPGSGGSALVRLNYTGLSVAGCTANPAGNQSSSPYVDYNSDSAYVGADNGVLYKITGVFKGTPTLAYCVTVNTTNKTLTSPVYDQVNNTVYVSDGYSVYGYKAGASGFTAAGSIQVASTSSGSGIALSPIVDSGDGFVYVFSEGDLTNAHSIVSQINLALTSQVTAEIGPAANQFVLTGDFDNAYFTGGPTTGQGTLYACGTDAGAGTKPSLYAISFSAPNGLMNTTPAMSDNRNINGASNLAGSCSPLLDFYDGITDRLFVGAGNDNATNGANLITEWNVTSRIASNATTPNNTAPGYWGGASAFTVDNVSPQPQAASIYFGTRSKPPLGTTTPCGANNFCAVKLTQGGLQ